MVGAGQRDHAAADAGGPGAARIPQVDRQVAYPRRARGRARGRGDQAMGQARLSQAGAPAARDGDHLDRAARREGARGPGRPAGAAGDRQLYRRGRGQLRLRPAARRARHQRAARAGPAGGRPARARRRAVGGGAAAGRIAAARRGPGRSPLVRRGDGTGRAGMHGRQPALRHLPGGSRLRLAGRGAAQRAGRGGQPPDPALRRHGPAMPGPPAGGAARRGRPGEPGRLRRGLGRPGPAGPGPGRARGRRPGRPAARRALRAARPGRTQADSMKPGSHGRETRVSAR